MPAGRKKIKVLMTDEEWDQFDKLISFFCTIEEIASFFKVSIDTVERRLFDRHNAKFAEYSSKVRDLGKIKLRKKQWDIAMSGNSSLLIWLGKQYLGQSDKQETKLDSSKIDINYIRADEC
jgi:Zn-dependent peptidase ImmA (M78 family)